MRIYAIGDLHLSSYAQKPMTIFGEGWAEHPERTRRAWADSVDPQDWVLIPGDISWGMRLPEALPDLLWIAQLPGRKVILRGNHDYWWPSITRLRQALPPDMYAIQNDSLALGDNIALCGTRGWTCPGSRDFSEHDERIFQREVARLELSLRSAPPGSRLWVMTHYPPVNERHDPNDLIELMGDYGVETCIYGHLHGSGHRAAITGKKFGINFHLVSWDYLGGVPLQLYPERERP